MNKVIIICDSTCDLSPELIEKNHIQIVPLHLVVEGDSKDYLDGVTLTTEGMYELVDKYNQLPKTGARNVNEFIEDFRPHIENGDDIIYTGIASALSSTYNNACIAAQEFPEGRIEIIDSQSLSAGSGLLALKMCKYRDRGLNVHQIAEKIRKIVPNVVVQSCVDKLDYLYKGGRCKAATKALANIFKIHPVVRIKEGAIHIYKLCRGKFEKGLDVQIEDFANDLENHDVDLSYIVVIDAFRTDGVENYLFEKVEALLKKQKEAYNLLRLKAGCVIAAHCGPKTTGLYYIKYSECKIK
ncbi:MAG: DegV family protein [Bacilli bacterium]|nr:DegV family protein [Bacilli bacterium]